MTKLKRLTGLMIGASILVSVAAGGAIAVDKLTTVKSEMTGLSDELAMQKLMQKSFDELLADVNTLGEDITNGDLIFHANALKEAAKRVPNEKLTQEINNEQNTNVAKTLLLQIDRLLLRESQDPDDRQAAVVDTTKIQKWAEMLEQEDVDFEIKRNALLNIYSMAPYNTELFEKVATAGDERLAFQAIKVLAETDLEKAGEISDAILQSYQGEVTPKVRAAIKTRAKQLEKNSSALEREGFVQLCDAILQTKLQGKNTEPTVETDTIVFALSDVLSPETISYIVESDKIDDIVKTSCIDQNYRVLKTMLTENPTEKNVKVVAEAMSIYPIQDMLSTVEETLDESERSAASLGQNDTVISELKEVKQTLEQDGLKATNKYE